VGIFERLRSWFGRADSNRARRRSLPANSIPEPILGTETAAQRRERRRRKRQNGREGTKVLVIDDSATIVAALKSMLRTGGYFVLGAAGAEKGVELARAERPHLIFLDIVLPGKDGFAALRILRRDPLTRDIPVIMISGNAQAVEQYYAYRIGADDFMKKPFSRFEVFARIECLLDANLVPRRWSTTAAVDYATNFIDVVIGEPA